MEQQKQPKIVQKLLLRTFFLLLGVAAVFLGIQYILNWRQDPDSGVADTNQMIAAIQMLDEGQQAVIFDGTGKKLPSPDFIPGKYDRDPVWRPDGNRLFFVSDRKDGINQLFRWNLASNKVEQRSTGPINRSDPTFPVVDDPNDASEVKTAGESVLLVQNGFVTEFSVKDGIPTNQLTPHPAFIGDKKGIDPGGEDPSSGAGLSRARMARAVFDQFYKKFGNAFRTARWLRSGNYMVGVMKGDEQETLVIQRIQVNESDPPEEQMKQALPQGLLSGDKIDIDVDPKQDRIVVTVLNFQFVDRDNIPPAYIKDRKPVKPFIHGVFFVDPTKPTAQALTPLVATNDVNQAFGPPAFSPDGSQVCLTAGTFADRDYAPNTLVVMPAQEGGAAAGTALVRGAIYEYSWHPTGGSLVYIKRDGKARAIFKINKDGSGETKVSDDGNYMKPSFSPQSK